MKFQCTVSGPGYGFVYIMSYPNSDKLKIGHSLDPGTRATNIGGTLAPEIPILEVYYWCSERREDVERKAHEVAKATRHNGEWFAIPLERAMKVIEQAADAVKVEVQLVFTRDDRGAKVDLKAMTKEERREWLARRRK